MSKINGKNNILAIETTSNICGVAITSNNKVLYENNLDKGLNHSITLFDNIDKAFKTTNIDIKDIDLIKVSNGPGSFTGLRIGIAAALGLSKPYNTAIEYVNTLDSLAHNIDNGDYYILSMIDARSDRVYISLYDGKTKEKLSCDSIVNIYELCDNLNMFFLNKNINFSFVGSGAVNYKNLFKNNLKINHKVLSNVSNLSASSLAITKGVVSKVPFTNYMLASKAERERNNN